MLLAAEVECVDTLLEVHLVLGLHFFFLSQDLLLDVLVSLDLENGMNFTRDVFPFLLSEDRIILALVLDGHQIFFQLFLLGLLLKHAVLLKLDLTIDLFLL